MADDGTLNPADKETGDLLRWRAGTLVYTSAGLVALFCWLLWGDFALAMRDRSVPQVLQLLLRKYGASDTVMSFLLQALPPAIGMFLGPIVSYKSDRFRSRWGRRIPFLLIPTPLAALGILGVAYSPKMAIALQPLYASAWAVIGQIIPRCKGIVVTENGAVLVTLAIAWTMFEVCAIVALSVVGGLINDVVPRPVLGRFYGLFRAVSLIAGMIFNGWIIGKAETHFVAIFVSVGLLYGIGFSIMCLKVKEGDYPPPVVNSHDPRARGFFGAVRIYFRECFSDSYYRWVFAAMLLAGLTFIPFNTFSIYYAKSVQMDMNWYGKLIAASYGVSLIIAYPLGWLVDRMHALRVGIVALALYAFAVAYGMLFVRDARTLGIALVAHTVLSGTYFTASASLGQALFPRLQFAQFASAAALVLAMGSILLGLVLGPVLDYSGHNYRLTFVVGFALCVASLVLMIMVYRAFMKLGGPEGYVAPFYTSQDTAPGPVDESLETSVAPTTPAGES